MELRSTNLPEVIEIIPTRHSDARGYFSEIFRADWFEANVSNLKFVQENESCSQKAGVIRGLHFQSEPSAQGKLVRCVSGAIFDVAVDIRRGSPDYGKWTSVILSGERGNQLWVPPGHLHGFCTLFPNSIVSYAVTAYYSHTDDLGVRWNDAQIAIAWPEGADPETLSEKDRTQPYLKDLPTFFNYEGVD